MMSTPTTDERVPRGVVIVGAGAAGLSVAEGLRRGGYDGRLRMFGAEEHLPYDRPPLSKQVLLGQWTEERTRLREPQQLDDLEIELHLGQRAAGLDTRRRTVRMHDTSDVHYDQLVIATGLTPRKLPQQRGLAGVHSIHSLEDARALRAGLTTAHRIVIVGSGVLGCEVAASARSLGVEVTMVSPSSTTMLRQLGPDTGGILAEMHRERGVDLRLSTRLDSLIGSDGHVDGVLLEDGELLSVDLVVIAVGSNPTTEWLGGSGLVLEDGIVCDDRCRAADRVWAAGDVARFPDPRTGALMRLENRTNATDQGLAVAANILGADEPYAPIPYFWTDQYDLKIQSHGTPAQDTALVHGSITDRRFVALHGDGDSVTGAVGFNRPKQTRQWRQHVVDRTPWPEIHRDPVGLLAESMGAA